MGGGGGGALVFEWLTTAAQLHVLCISYINSWERDQCKINLCEKSHLKIPLKISLRRPCYPRVPTVIETIVSMLQLKRQCPRVGEGGGVQTPLESRQQVATLVACCDQPSAPTKTGRSDWERFGSSSGAAGPGTPTLHVAGYASAF